MSRPLAVLWVLLHPSPSNPKLSKASCAARSHVKNELNRHWMVFQLFIWLQSNRAKFWGDSHLKHSPRNVNQSLNSLLCCTSLSSRHYSQDQRWTRRLKNTWSLWCSCTSVEPLLLPTNTKNKSRLFKDKPKFMLKPFGKKNSKTSTLTHVKTKINTCRIS